MAKKFYWLKLQRDFFNSYRMKKLRTMAGGDTLTIIYLKLQLLTLDNDGIYQFRRYEDAIEKELAFELGENVDDIKLTLLYLQNVGLATISDDGNLFLPYVIENTGSETDDAKRKRVERAKSSVGIAQNADIVRTLSETVQKCPTEKEKEIEKDIDNNAQIAQDFSAFWNAYPKKKDKQKAQDCFTKLSKKRILPEIDVLVASIERQKKSKEWTKENGQFIPYPTTWLNGRRWEDEESPEIQISDPDYYKNIEKKGEWAW